MTNKLMDLRVVMKIEKEQCIYAAFLQNSVDGLLNNEDVWIFTEQQVYALIDVFSTCNIYEALLLSTETDSLTDSIYFNISLKRILNLQERAKIRHLVKTITN